MAGPDGDDAAGGGGRRLGPFEREAVAGAKISGPPSLLARLRGLQGNISATVRVNVAGYVPRGLTLRARIDPTLFTADVPVARLPELEADSAVVAVQPALPLPPFPVKEGD
jgi:hypothetical protein